MKIEFYLYNPHEIVAWAPIWRALVQRGVAAQFVVEPPGVHTAFGTRPDAGNGYRDTKTADLVPLMTDEMYAQVLGHLARADYAYAKKADYSADAVVTTQGRHWIKDYQGLKVRTGYGVSPHRDAWGYGETVNQGLDAIVTHGELPAALTRRHAPAERVLVGGYPKFDAYLRGEVDRTEWLTQFGLDSRRPIVVYFSTWAHNSSLDSFARTIAGLTADYNVLYKPHHNNLFFEQERLELLRQTTGVVVGQELSSVPYYAVADLVMADVRSGSLTEAFLTDRRVIGLSPYATPDADQLIAEIAAVVDVCRDPLALPALVAASLDQAAPPADQRALTPRLFSDYQGHAAAVTADMLIDQVERARRRPPARSVARSAATPLFSVVIPTYQRPEVLKKCLDALARQSVPPEDFEVLVSDDGSLDNTPDVVRAYQAPYQLTYLRQENSGPAAARNRAIEQARGEYLLILNDDALLEPDAIAIHQADQAQGGGQEAVLGMFRFLPEHMATPFGYLMQNSFLLFAYGTVHGNQMYQLTPGQRLNHMWFYTCNLSVRRQHVLDVGGFDEWFSAPAFEDLDLGLRLEQAGVPLRYDPRALAWHDHAQSPERYVRVNTMRKRWMLAFCLKHPSSAWYRSLSPELARKWREDLLAAAPKAKQAQARLEQMDASVLPGAPEDELKRIAMEMYPIACWLTDYTDRRGMLESPHLEAFLKANVAAAGPSAPTAPVVPPPTRAALRRERKARRAQGDEPALALSVVIPTYNRREALARCLAALNAQTLSVKRFEVIVVDDGSTDGTSDWLAQQSYSFTLRRFQQANAGPGAARNRGASEAHGEVVLFMGDDIYAPPKLLAGHLNFHHDFPGQFEAVVGRVEWADNAPVTPFMRYIVGPSGVQFGFDAIRDPEQAGYRYFYTCNISLKRSLLAGEQPLFDTEYWYPAWEDIDLGFRLQARGLRLRYRRALLAHHDHQADLTRYQQRQFRAGQMACLFARKHPHAPEARQTEALEEQYRQSTYQAQVLADTTSDERLMAAAAKIEAAFADRPLDAENQAALERAYAQVLQRAYVRGILAGAAREVAPAVAAPAIAQAPAVATPSQPAVGAEALLARLVEAPDPGAVLREHLDQLDAEFLGLVRLRARAARQAGQAELAADLTELANGVAGLLETRAAAPAAARAAELYERLLNGEEDLGLALERHAGELSDDFLALVRSNAVGARQVGDLALAEGLDGFADAVVSYLAP